jgi:hypothetical protein
MLKFFFKVGAVDSAYPLFAAYCRFKLAAHRPPPQPFLLLISLFGEKN